MSAVARSVTHGRNDLTGRTFDTLRDLIEGIASRYGDREALLFEDRTYSFRDLDRIATALAGALQARGMAKGDRLALLCNNSADMLFLLLACAKAGIVFVPINPAMTHEEIGYLLEHSESSALAVDPETLETAEAVLPRTHFRFVCTTGEAEIDGLPSVTQLVAERRPFERVAIGPEDVVALMYTSGTTSKPKGAMLPNRAYGYGPAARGAHLGWGPIDRVLTVTPLFHIQGQAYVTLAGLANGATVVLRRRFSASSYWDDVRAYGITTTGGLRTIPLILWNRPEQPNDADNPMRSFVGGLPAEIWEAFERRFGLVAVSGYGQTEDMATIQNYPDRERRKLAPGILGVPIGDERQQVAIVDDEGNPVPIGETGEIAKFGPGVMLGYYKDPEATAAVLQNGWFRTGDYGRMDEDGFIYFVDRKKDMIKRSGENISAAEIEAVLNSHPEIAECAAIGVPDPIRNEEVKVFVRLNEGTTQNDLPPPAIFAYLAERVAPFKLPRYLEYVSDFPRTSTLKIQKQQLKAQQPGIVWERRPDGSVERHSEAPAGP